MVPAKVKLGQAVLDLNLPAWLVVRLRLSATTPKSGKLFYFNDKNDYLPLSRFTRRNNSNFGYLHDKSLKEIKFLILI